MPSSNRDHDPNEQRPEHTSAPERGTRDDETDRPADEKPSILKKTWVRIVLVLILVAGTAGGAVWFSRWWTHGRFVQSTDDAYLQADKVTVSARIAGVVEKVMVADNQRVVAGQELVRIDDRDPRARFEQAQAQADQARASIAEAAAQISQQEAQITQSQAQLAGSRTQVQFAVRQVARYAPLAQSGAETGERLDQLRQNRDQAQTQVAQNAAAVLSAQRKIGTLQAQIAQGQSQIEQAQAQMRRAQVDLDATVVRASIDGRLGDKTVQVGQYVQTGTRLMSVVPVDALHVVGNFKETQIGRMRVGQPATITVDALPDHELRGTVDSFAPGTGAQFALVPPSNATGNFTKIVQRVAVRIQFDAGPEARQVLVPGLSVTVAVDTEGAQDRRDGQGPSQ